MGVEAFAVLRDPAHPKHSPGCPACGIMGDVAYVLLGALADKATEDELLGIAMVLSDINNPDEGREPDPPFFDADAAIDCF